MSQPKTTSQNPKPPSGAGCAAEKNLSLWRYLPRSTPSISDTATLTRLPGAVRTASSTFCGAIFCGIRFSPDLAVLAGERDAADCNPPNAAEVRGDVAQ